VSSNPKHFETPENAENAESQSVDKANEHFLLEPQRGVKGLLNLGDDRRTTGRFTQESLECNLGPVLDLSTGGMRVLCKRPHQGTLEVRLRASQYSLALSGQVAWSKRLGFRRHEIGVQFVDLDDDTSHILSRISASYRMRRAL